MQFMTILLSVLLLASNAKADEISLLSGFYRSTSNDPGNDSTEISAGARYGFPTVDTEQWYIQAQVIRTSFKGDNAPDTQSVFQLGGGKRYYFKRFSPRFIPYLSWLALLSKQDSGGDDNQFGIFYSGAFGIRIPLSPKFFVNFESNLFTSALTSTTESSDGNGGTNKVKKTELYIDSVGAVNESIFSIGYKLQ